MKQKLFASVAAVMLLSSLAVPALGCNVHASERKDQSSVVLNESNYSAKDLSVRTELAKKMKGINLNELKFDRSKMTIEQQAALDSFLEYEYNKAVETGKSFGLSKEVYTASIEKLAYEVNNSKQVDSANPLLDGMGFSRQKPHGWVSCEALGNVLNVILDGWLFAMGAPSFAVMQEMLGKTALLALIDKEVLDLIIKGGASFGLKFSYGIVSATIGRLIEAIVDPGGLIANIIDKNDVIPGNHWIELK